MNPSSPISIWMSIYLFITFIPECQSRAMFVPLLFDSIILWMKILPMLLCILTNRFVHLYINLLIFYFRICDPVLPMFLSAHKFEANLCSSCVDTRHPVFTWTACGEHAVDHPRSHIPGHLRHRPYWWVVMLVLSGCNYE